MSLRVGFIGLGNRGKPIAAHLAPAGFETTVYDIAQEPVRELVAGGARAAATPRELGGAARAANKQITYLIGGPEAALETARPYLAATTDVPIVYAGELGNGAKLELCINLITCIQWAAAYESMALARAIGLPQEVLEEAGRSNGQITDLMSTYLMGHEVPDEVKSSEGFRTLMRSHMRIAEKDLAWALELARKAGVALPVGGLVSQSMARLYNVEDEWRR